MNVNKDFEENLEMFVFGLGVVLLIIGVFGLIAVLGWGWFFANCSAISGLLLIRFALDD